MASASRYIAASAVLGAGGAALGMGVIPGLPVIFANAAAPVILGTTGVLLPAAWKLIETVPPLAKKIVFPAISLVFKKVVEDKQNVTAPLWQKLLGTGALAAIALAVSDPRIETHNLLEKGEGPVVMVVDNDWSAARDWSIVQKRMQSALESAERQGRPVMIVPTAPASEAGIIAGTLQPAGKALESLAALEPRPWPSDRKASIAALREQKDSVSGASVLWFSNGQDDGQAAELQKTLEAMGDVSIVTHAPGMGAHLLSLREGEDLGAIVRRLSPGAPENLLVTAVGASGEVLAQAEAHFAENDVKAEVSFDLPPELRRQIVKLALPGEHHAGAVVLLDESWRKRSIGLLGGAERDSLLSDSYYIRPAVSAYANLHTGSVGELLQNNLSAIIMTDEAILNEDERARLEDWIAKGGMLLRFAGPRLAARPDDSLTPVPLLRGQNHLGGEFSGGGQSSGLTEFEDSSPLAGLPLPQGLEIKTRILPEAAATAEPGVEVWAGFTDGVPFISARKQGEGWMALVHSAANLEWSNLPLSDEFFLDMMKSLIGKSKSAGAEAELTKALPPLNVLDAEGRLVPAGAASIELTRERARDGRIGPASPPGFYGEGSVSKHAHNLYRGIGEYKALEPDTAENTAGKTKTLTYQESAGPEKLAVGLLLSLMIALLAADLVARGRQHGKEPAPRRRRPGHGRAPVRAPEL